MVRGLKKLDTTEASLTPPPAITVQVWCAAPTGVTDTADGMTRKISATVATILPMRAPPCYLLSLPILPGPYIRRGGPNTYLLTTIAPRLPAKGWTAQW